MSRHRRSGWPSKRAIKSPLLAVHSHTILSPSSSLSHSHPSSSPLSPSSSRWPSDSPVMTPPQTASVAATSATARWRAAATPRAASGGGAGKGRTLKFVLDYIAVGNEPRLTMPPRRSSWLPRRMGGSTSSSSSSGARSVPHYVTPPCLNSGRRVPMRSGTLRINECRPASPSRGLFRRLVKPKTKGKKKAPEEWQAPPDYLRAAARMGAPEEEFPGERLALEASFNEVLPAPDDIAEAWLARMYEEEEVERQRRILEELERERAAAQHLRERRERAAATGGRRIPPPPPPPEYYILDPSDEDEDAPSAPGPSRWHGGDAGEGPSNAAGSGSDGDDGDGGDYTVFYSQLGM